MFQLNLYWSCTAVDRSILLFIDSMDGDIPVVSRGNQEQRRMHSFQWKRGSAHRSTALSFYKESKTSPHELNEKS
jgi:hypothetical protein